MIKGLGHNGPSLASGSICSEWSWVENFNNGEHWPTVRRLSLLLACVFFIYHLRAVWFCNYRLCGWQIHGIWEYGVMLPAEELSGFSSPLFRFPPFHTQIPATVEMGKFQSWNWWIWVWQTGMFFPAKFEMRAQEFFLSIQNCSSIWLSFLTLNKVGVLKEITSYAIFFFWF